MKRTRLTATVTDETGTAEYRVYTQDDRLFLKIGKEFVSVFSLIGKQVRILQKIRIS
jgi:hypothetical protein